MAKRRKKKRRPATDVKVIGPPARELVERIRMLLEEELTWREKRYQENQDRELRWRIRRYENALLALEELERRVAE